MQSTPLDLARDHARATFNHASIPRTLPFPEILLPHLHDPTSPNQAASPHDLLTRPPPQRDPHNPRRRHAPPEYDVLHFAVPPSAVVPSGYDEFLARGRVHHDIAFAVRKVEAAREALRERRFAVEYAVPEAYLLVVMKFLFGRQEGVALDVRHSAMDVEVLMEEEEDGEGEDPLLDGSGKVKQLLFRNPHYVLRVQDLSFIQAYEALMGECMMFGVSDRRRRVWMAYVFFTEKVGHGGDGSMLDFDLEVKIFPSNHVF